MNTSRIVQANASVQLFVQRILMNLEHDIEFGYPETKQWMWRKNYRVWEANRKIFLYPENYLDPSIRQSKTKIFKDLENSLQQGNLNQENIETAFRKYLEGFAELASLVYVDAYYMDDQAVSGCGSPTGGSPNSLFFFAIDKKLFAHFELTDTIRESAKYAIKQIQDLGVKVVMLTGACFV